MVAKKFFREAPVSYSSYTWLLLPVEPPALAAAIQLSCLVQFCCHLKDYFTLYCGSGPSLRRAVTKSAIPATNDAAPRIPGNELFTCSALAAACVSVCAGASFLGGAIYSMA